MGFSPGSGGGSSSIAGSTDVALNSPQDDQVLAYESASAKWQNAFGQGGGSGGGIFITVASSTASSLIKSRADYVCSGSNDQVQINNALSAVQADPIGSGGAGGTVMLSAGTFSISSPILMCSRTTLSGSGWGTQLEPTGTNLQSVIALGDGDATHMTVVKDLTIHGNARGAHGIHYVQNAGPFPDISAPDAYHHFYNLNIFRVGSAANPRDGICLEGTNGGGRGTKMSFVRVRNPWRHGINIQGFSDNKLSYCGTNTRAESSGHGFVVGGGNCEISGSKAFYTTGDGFHITSSRSNLVNCVSQDAGRHGFYLASTGTVITGGQADSNGRLEPGDGYHMAGSGYTITGVRSADRGQTPSSPQRYGFNFVSGTNKFVTGTAGSNGVSDSNGSPGANSYVRIATESSGVISFG